MPTPRKTGIDKIVDIYRDMPAEERPFVLPTIRGIDRFLAAKPATPDEQATFEELGERAAEEVAGG